MQIDYFPMRQLSTREFYTRTKSYKTFTLEAKSCNISPYPKGQIHTDSKLCSHKGASVAKNFQQTASYQLLCHFSGFI
jgi:hypothetical protein